jgi:hypothetical protein
MMTERQRYFADAIAELERDVETWRAKIAETESLIRALRERLHRKPKPKPSKKPKPKRKPRAVSDVAETKREKAKLYMRKRRAAAAAKPLLRNEKHESVKPWTQAGVSKTAFYRAQRKARASEPPSPEVIIRDGVRWVKDAAGSLSREHSAEPPPSPLIGRESSSAVRRSRGNADATT